MPGTTARQGTGRRLVGILFSLAAAASVVLFLAVAVVWRRSYAGAYDVRSWGYQSATSLFVSNGQVTYWRGRAEDPANPYSWTGRIYVYHPGQPYTFVLSPQLRRYVDGAGFGFAAGLFPLSGERRVEVIVPCWFVLGLTSVAPALWGARAVRRRHLRRRRRPGRCTNCGYDLRASSGRCPECGSEFAPQTPAA